MTAITYLVKYEDEFGVGAATIVNDGKKLRLTVRGVEFISHNFHSFSISSTADDSKRKLFNLFIGDLCGYSLNCQIPVLCVRGDGIEIPAMLHAHIEYGKPVDSRTRFHNSDGTEFEVNQQIDTEILELEIEFQGKLYISKGRNQYNSFDEQLAELRDVLPSGVYLKTCWNCAFSDYHPAGSGIFGDLACFRNLKAEYRQVKDKFALMHLWNQRAESVQEVHLCPEFEKRKSGNGGFYVG
ncbi:MAG: DUF6304 family protein [Anaerolineales bacterium]